MAEESKSSNTLIWVLVAAVVLFFLYQMVAKKAEKITKASAGAFGEGLGKGATHTILSEGAGALGSFLGGIFGSKKGAAHETPDDELDDENEEYDTSSFRVYDDE